MKKSKSPFFLFLIIVICSNLFTEINIAKLNQLSQIYLQSFRSNNLEANRLAAEQGWKSRISFPDGKVMELHSLSMTGKILINETHNAISAKTISTNEVHPSGSSGYNLTGNTLTLHEWDGGSALSTHQELTGRVTIGDSGDSPFVIDHATHVAGTMIASGVDSEAKGMSYQADLVSYDWNNAESEMAAEAASGAIISNHSYGFVNGWSYDYHGDGLWAWLGNTSVSNDEDNWFGLYTSYSANWDNIAYNAPNYLIVKSSGNDRNDNGPTPGTEHWIWTGEWELSTATHGPDGPWDCISSKGVSKNILTVGAVNDIPLGYSSESDVVATSFSSWGPVDDGRIKPDVVANGSLLKSSVATSNTSYDWYSGTSMSSPSAAGSAGLIQQFFYNIYSTWMLSSTLKALIIHTADESGPDTGPDYMFGWGLMNTERAIDFIALRDQSDYIIEETLSDGETYQIDIETSGIEPLKATLCWTDLPGTPPGNLLDPSNPMLVNDLDMRITRSGYTGYPWKLDRDNPSNSATNNSDNAVDNVEQVYYDSPGNDNYTITITHKGNLSADQDFSLIISGVIINPPEITVSPSQLDVSIQEDQTLEEYVNIDNSGSGDLHYDTGISYLTRKQRIEREPEIPEQLGAELKGLTGRLNSDRNYVNDRDDVTLNYDTNDLGNGIGTNGVYSWISMARFTSTELSPYYDSYFLKSIQFVINSEYFSNVTIKVYEGGSLGNVGTEIYSQDVTSQILAGTWTTIQLDTPIFLVSGNEYWIGYAIDATYGYPAGTDNGPVVTNKGDVIYWGGWTSLTAFEIEWNWHIRGILSPSWVRISNNENGILPGTGRTNQDVTLEFKSTGLTMGTEKTAELSIISNDPDEPITIIPITMTVTGLQPDPPLNVIIDVSSGNAQISWDPVTGASSYSIYSDTDPEGIFNTLEISGIIGTSWTDTSPESDKKFYIIKAVN